MQTTYWADWMIHKKGMKVYLRRDIKNYKEAWVFNAKNDEFIGKADLSIFLNKEEPPKKKKFYYWNTDKELDEPDEELYLRGTDRKITEQQKKIGCG